MGNGATMCPKYNNVIVRLPSPCPRSYLMLITDNVLYASPLDAPILFGQVPLVREIMAGNKRGKRLLSLDD